MHTASSALRASVHVCVYEEFANSRHDKAVPNCADLPLQIAQRKNNGFKTVAAIEADPWVILYIQK